jgi:small-conductance mechanosensitive channel
MLFLTQAAVANMQAAATQVVATTQSVATTQPTISSVVHGMPPGGYVLQTFLKLQGMAQEFFRLLPGLVMGAVILVVFVFLARIARSVVNRIAFDKRSHPHLAVLLSRLAYGATIVLGVLLAATASFPSFTPAGLFASLGVGTVAIGFAFRDILQNYLAGILLLLTEPFRIGDQIIFGSYEGTVEDIQARATLIKTYDGRRVVIPNGSLFVESVEVNTAFQQRRSEFDVGIGYSDDIATARRVMLEAMKNIDGVANDPAPEVLLVSLSDYSVNLRARWWTKSPRIEQLRVQDLVLEAIKNRAIQEGIDLPYPTRQILFHDQTEPGDGDRRRQREGWPAKRGEAAPGPNGPTPPEP